MGKALLALSFAPGLGTLCSHAANAVPAGASPADRASVGIQNVPGLIGFLLLAPLLLSSSVCLADPVPVDLGRWEINNY